MTLEERKERFYNFHGCTATVCDDCVYHGGLGLCADRITEDAKALLKESADELTAERIKTLTEQNKPPKYEAPLCEEEREQIRELVRVETELPDLLAHFVQEINELCCCFNDLAAIVGKLEQLRRGTDPAGKVSEAELKALINADVGDIIEEAADVHNYLFVLGFDRLFTSWPDDRDHKLARWANRLNGVSDE